MSRPTTGFAHDEQVNDKAAEYAIDDDGLVVAKVPGATGFFTQGDTVEEARQNLRDAIEGNVLLALQLGLSIPPIPGIAIREVPWQPNKHGKTQPTQRKPHSAQVAP